MAIDVKLSVILGLATFAALGLADFIRKKAVSSLAYTFSYFLFETLVLGIFVFSLTLIVEGRVTLLDAPTFVYAAIAGSLVGAGIAALLLGLRFGEASSVVPIGRLSLLLTAVLGLAFLNEQLTFQKALGIALGVAAVILLSR